MQFSTPSTSYKRLFDKHIWYIHRITAVTEERGIYIKKKTYKQTFSRILERSYSTVEIASVSFVNL